VKRRLPALLAVAVVARMAFHALYLPAFEGPDEPQHLARVLDFARLPLAEAFAGRRVDPEMLETLAAYPCRAELQAAIGCPGYAVSPGAFDLVRAAPAVIRRSDFRPFPNVEANQPPLFYLAAGLLLRPFDPTTAAALLSCRLLAVALVAFALFGPLRALARAWPPALSAACLLALLVPGASEGLARCSNEAAVFLWASLVLAALAGRARSVVIVLLVAAGPLIKLTAIPVVVFAVSVCALEGRAGLAAAGAAASLLLFPVQALRGWMWGGTLELNAPGGPIVETAVQAAAGFVRSAYAFVKTTMWVGGSSLIRPPRWLVVAYGAGLAALGLALRRRPDSRRRIAHGAALIAACAGFAVFAIANRRYYGDWGGVAGWYAWGWSPWLAAAAWDLAAVERRFVRLLLAAEAVFVVASNAAWFARSAAVYGG
jgi:hypothetical protein